MIGVGGQQGLLFRNGSGGHVSNGLICNTSEGIEIEDKADELEDAYQRFLAGDLTLNDIVVTGGVAALDYDGEGADGAETLNTYAAENDVVSEEVDGLDDMFAFEATGTFAIDPLYLEVGQGSGQAWAIGWTFCAQRGLFASTPASVEGPTANVLNDVNLFPNPTANSSVLNLPSNGQFDVLVFSATGALVSKAIAQTNVVTMPNLTGGNYVVLVRGEDASKALKWLVQ